jgi:hypothetical protein
VTFFKPPSEAWEPWVYRAAMMLIGLSNIVGVLWLHYDLTQGPWPADTALQRLEWLFWLGLCNFALLGLQLYGLVARNLARVSLKLKAGKDGFEGEVG